MTALPLLMLGSALAADGGVLLHPAAPAPSASLRTVAAPGPITVLQQVPRLRMGSDRFTLDLQLPVVEAFDGEGWSEVGVGRLRLGARVHIGDERRHALVLEGGAVPAPRSAWLTTWGSHSRETLPGYDVVFGWEFDPDVAFDWTLRLAAGLNSQAYSLTWFPVYGEVMTSQVIALGTTPVSVVLEEEAMLFDQIGLSARALARLQATDRLTVDVGVQLPMLYWADAPTLPQVVAQARLGL